MADDLLQVEVTFVQILSDQINYLKINGIDAKRGLVLGLRASFLIAKR